MMTEELKTNLKHPIDWRWDNRQMHFFDFKESNNFEIIKKKLNSIVKLPNTIEVASSLDYFEIEYKTDDSKKILIETSQLLSYLIGKNIWILYKSNEIWIKRTNKFKNKYFWKEKFYKDHLIYYIAKTLSKEDINVYIIDNQEIRVSDRTQYRKSKMLGWEKYGCLQIPFNQLLSYSFTWKLNNFEIEDREYNLSEWESKIIRELRLDKYSKKEVKIDIRWDWTLRKMTISGIENDLTKQWFLKSIISPNWFVAVDDDFWLASKLVIEERFQLEKWIDKE